MTSEQIQKLKSLGELLENGTISKEEFNALKNEILNEQNQSTEQQVNSQPSSNQTPKTYPESQQVNSNKQKIRLIGFQNTTTQKFIDSPKIESLDFNNIAKVEENQLKAFLRLKQIFAPANFTRDEINIGNILFTRLDIERINSERPGLNFPWAVIISVLTAGLSLFLMYVSPCFGFLGAGTGMVSATAISIFVLTRVSATKLDKILSVIAIILSIGAFIAYQSYFSSEEVDTSSAGKKNEFDYSDLVSSGNDDENVDNTSNYNVDVQDNNSYEKENYNSGGSKETMIDAMEKISDPTYCSLCKGTGVEVNRARGMGLGDDEYGRVCPMCNGSGKRSY
jgi:hypothetical protein